jgi:hypothetical protein
MKEEQKIELVKTEEKIDLGKIGNIIMLKDGKEEYPFRVAPLLWKMGVIGTKNAIDNIISCIGGTRKEAKRLLRKYGDADARLIPIIDEIKLAEAE